MGLLDSITSMLGANGQAPDLNALLEGVLGKGHPEIANLLKNIDMSKAGEIMEFVQKNGVPDTMEEIQQLISKFTK